jgi:hypothetical protein
MPHLGPDQAEGGVRLLLEQEALRRRFDNIHLLTLEPDGHAAHAVFEPLVDGIYHLGQLGLEPRARLDLARQVVEHTAASDLLVVNGKAACDLIPLLREAKRATRAAALFHDPEWGEHADTPAVAGIRHLASQYAALVHRVACTRDEMTAHLVDMLYFPRAKVRTFRPPPPPAPPESGGVQGGVGGLARWADAVADWLTPEAPPAADQAPSLFGIADAPSPVGSRQ